MVRLCYSGLTLRERWGLLRERLGLGDLRQLVLCFRLDFVHLVRVDYLIEKAVKVRQGRSFAGLSRSASSVE